MLFDYFRLRPCNSLTRNSCHPLKNGQLHIWLHPSENPNSKACEESKPANNYNGLNLLEPGVKRELENLNNHNIKRMDKVRKPFPRFCLTHARFQYHVQYRHSVFDEHSCRARTHLSRIPFQKGSHQQLPWPFLAEWKQLECNYLVVSSHRRAFSVPRAIPPRCFRWAFVQS